MIKHEFINVRVRALLLLGLTSSINGIEENFEDLLQHAQDASRVFRDVDDINLRYTRSAAGRSKRLDLPGDTDAGARATGSPGTAPTTGPPPPINPDWTNAPVTTGAPTTATTAPPTATRATTRKRWSPWGS